MRITREGELKIVVNEGEIMSVRKKGCIRVTRIQKVTPSVSVGWDEFWFQGVKNMESEVLFYKLMSRLPEDAESTSRNVPGESSGMGNGPSSSIVIDDSDYFAGNSNQDAPVTITYSVITRRVRMGDSDHAGCVVVLSNNPMMDPTMSKVRMNVGPHQGATFHSLFDGTRTVAIDHDGWGAFPSSEDCVEVWIKTGEQQ
ncbi:hypothetical protein F4604DRAFT_1900041 [Suillus subluteus]|nr:hypothetical protein F4604DRAFT_1900041 [Suillus subluteus]